ncbi:MAG: Hsp33 family molecular chaperone HslO, partial [Gammaproteobacteria bacterium]
VAEQGRVEVGCDFCGQQYHFDAADVGEMFADASARPDAPDTLQ